MSARAVKAKQPPASKPTAKAVKAKQPPASKPTAKAAKGRTSKPRVSKPTAKAAKGRTSKPAAKVKPGAAETIARLETMLRHDDPGACLMAARILLRRPDGRATVSPVRDRILEIALDASAARELRQQAADALAALGDPSVAPRLAAALARAEAEIAPALGAALEKLQTGAPRPASPDAVDRLLAQATAGGDWLPRCRAVEALREYDDPRVVPALEAALDDEQPAIRREAIVGLGQRGARSALPRLVAFVEQGGSEFTAAVEALARIGGPDAERQLASDAVFERAMRVLDQSQAGRIADRVLPALRTPDLGRRLATALVGFDDAAFEASRRALEFLVARKDPAAAIPLARAAVDPARDEEARGDLLWGLRKLAAATGRPPPDVVDELGAHLAAVDASALDALRRLVDDPPDELGPAAPDWVMALGGPAAAALIFG